MSGLRPTQPTRQNNRGNAPGRLSAYSQAVELQDLLFQDAHNAKVKPRERALVACAWERLEERKRILRMKPKPKDVDVAAALAEKRQLKRQAEGFTGPTEP